ncbi:Uncharacterised protein [Mycobacterium tuberculosis]|nr:Uncharacterised protein [Mycobacterium tuberculosis]
MKKGIFRAAWKSIWEFAAPRAIHSSSSAGMIMRYQNRYLRIFSVFSMSAKIAVTGCLFQMISGGFGRIQEE